MSETWRLFIALPLPPDLQRAAGRVQDRLRKTGADVSCPLPGNLHFTLAFLGQTFQERVPELIAGLDDIAARWPSFPPLADPPEAGRFQISSFGFFGPPRHPRVVWAGVPEPPPALSLLHKSVLAIVTELGFTIPKSAWQPHLTLGRIRSGRGVVGLTELVDSLKEEPLGECPVDRVELMRSHLDQPRVCYTVLHSAQLKGN